jgi:putative ABC transport system permease protein
LKVRSILRIGADAEKRAYVPLELVQDIENFRAGIPVAHRGWLGPAAPPQQAFDSAYLALENPLDEVELFTLCVRHGFATCSQIEPAEFEKRTGHSRASTMQIVHFSNIHKTVRGLQLANLMGGLADRKFDLLPIADDLQVTPVGSKSLFRVRAAIAEGWPAWRADASFAQVQHALLPAQLAETLKVAAGGRIRLNVKPNSQEDATQSLTITVIIDKLIDRREIVLHPSLVGMLLQARSVPLSFDENLTTLLAKDIGFRGYRLYAKTIDDVPSIARALQKDGTQVRAKAEAIEQLQRLDAALTRITLIVATVALLGGTAVLVASFSAAVERKKSDLSFLRLLGFSRVGVFSFPILQSIMLALGGFVLALALFFAFAALINNQYAVDLTVKGDICKLAMGHIFLFAGTTIFIALMSSLVAASYALRIDPAEALRRE